MNRTGPERRHYDLRVKSDPDRELRLDVDPGFRLPDLGGRPLPPRTFTSTYYDTAGRRLGRAGVTLRRRVESRTGLWQLKLPSEIGYELEERGGPGGPPERFLRLLPALLRGGATLEPVATLRTRRAGVTVGTRADRIEVVIETVAVLEGRRVASTFAALEATVVAGSGDRLAAIGKTLRKAGARRPGGRSKIAELLEPPLPEPAAADAGALARLQELLADQYTAMLGNDPGVRLGEDAEALHQLRVATRRSRALLRAARGLVAGWWAEPLRAELAWLGGLLGPVRDLDVLLEHLDVEAAVLEGDDARAFRRLRKRLADERDDDRATLLHAMDEPRYYRLLDTLVRAGSAPAGDGEVSLTEIAEAAFARLRRAAKSLPKKPTDDELHAVRIDTKRARYAAELAAPALGKAGARLVERAKDLQDVIGEHQDAVVAEARIRSLAERGGGRTGLAAGRLVERQHARKRAARRAYPDAWRRLDKAGRAAFG